MSADRNLLFGALALQLDLLTREQLIAGMQAWVLAKHRPLADVLVEMGALSPAGRELLEPLFAEHIRQHNNDPQQSLAAISSAGLLKDDLARIADDELGASLPHLAAGSESDPGSTMSVGEVTSPGVRFRILRPHAQGGLGRVYVALDKELNREVALKEIQPGCAHNQSARLRFMLEAEVTGGLEHPGIVPVYGLGAYPDGRPFYAMRFIKGDSLRNTIDQFHAPAADGSRVNPYRNPERQLQLRQFLGRFIDVCQAVGYAHSRGVLHRDLKPGNIMLGKYGETLVVDWGLAKARPQEDQPPATLASEAAFAPASGSSVELTQMGVMVGTLQYMSPEQAGGRQDLLGPATDIFSLGATLYHLLTGHSPYHGLPREDLEGTVLACRFPLPRQVNPDIPRPLEAICLKAMRREPGDRYRNTEALIGDLEHYLADEPVTAFNESWLVRTRRWFRKRPAVAATLAASLVMGLAALGIGSLLLGRKNQELAQANIDLKTARDKAIQNEATAKSQKQRADNNAAQAASETGRANEQSRLAGEREQDARWSAYVAAMNVAFPAWQNGYVGRAQRILDEQIPPSMQPDLRGPEWYLLWKLCHQESATLRAHRKRVTAVEYSPDGQTLASASDDGTVILWNTADWTIRKQLADHQAPVKAIVFSPTAPWMATAGNDGKIRFWDTNSWQQTRELQTGLYGNYDLHPLSLAISPNGKRLVVAGSPLGSKHPTTTRVLDTTTWSELWRLYEGHAGVAVSPDSQAVVVSSHSGRTHLYDLDTGRELASYQQYSFAIGFTPSGEQILSFFGSQGIYSRTTGLFSGGTITQADYRRDLAITPSGATAIVTGGTAEHATLELWDVSRNQITRRFNGHVGPVWSVAITPGASEFATGGEDATVRIWDGRWLADSVATGGHTGTILAATLSPDGGLAATGCTDKVVCLWNAKTGALLRYLRQPERVFGLAFSPNGKWLAIASSSPAGDGLRLYSTESQREEVIPLGNLEAISVAFSPDGSRLACGVRDGRVMLVDVGTHQVIGTRQVHSAAIYAVAYSHGGGQLATGSGDNTCRLLDSQTLAVKQTLRGHTGAVRGVSFAVGDQRLASASIDASIKVWNLQSGAVAATLAKQPLPAYTYSYGAGFTADGKSLVGLFINRADESELRIFDANTLMQTATIAFPETRAYALGLSPDGQRAISGLDGGQAVVSGLTDDAPKLALGERPDCYSCAFSPDSTKAAIGGFQTVRVIDVASRREIFARQAGTEPVTSVVFTAGGRELVTLEGNRDRGAHRPGTMHAWDASSGEELAAHRLDNRYGLAALSSDGASLALAHLAHQGGSSGWLELWDARTRQVTAKVPRPVNVGYGGLAFSPDGQTLAAGEAYYFNNQPGSIWLFAAGSKTPYAELRGHTSSVSGLVFLADGQTLVSAGNDQCLQVWNARTGEMLRRIDVTETSSSRQSGAGVAGLVAIPRSDRIAVLCDTGSVRIWETKTWHEVGSYSIESAEPSSLAVAPDGKAIMVTSALRQGAGPGYEIFNIAAQTEVTAQREAETAFVGHNLEEKNQRELAAAPHLKALDEAHAAGQVSSEAYYLANRLLRADPSSLDATDRDKSALLEAACRGTLSWQELPAKLAKVEPAGARAGRLESEARKRENEDRNRRIAGLLTEAKANDSPEKAPAALDALARLLRIDPPYAEAQRPNAEMQKHKDDGQKLKAEAQQLKAKIEAYHPLKTITNSLEMKLAELRPARFWMGSPLEEEGRNPDETLHPVRLTKACYLGAHEVKRGQFARFAEAAGYVTEAERSAAANPDSPTWRNPGFDQTDDHPVVLVSWNDARAFCDWLSKKESKTYRLPTEAEWELAARAGTITPFVWGQRADEGEGWGNLAGQERKNEPVVTALFSWDDGIQHTSPVGRFKANAWGLFDLAGNVSEWCQDQYQAYSLSLEVDPVGGRFGTPPVVRGSSWASEPAASRCAFRHRMQPGDSSPQVGFRVLLEDSK